MGVAGLFTLAITSACLDAGQFLKMTRRLVKGVLRICCTGNPARSIIAESILRKEAGHRFKAYSAGTGPSLQVNPLALEVLKQKGPARSGEGGRHRCRNAGTLLARAGLERMFLNAARDLS